MAITKQERDTILDELELLLGQERWAEGLGLLEQLPEDDSMRYLQAVDIWIGMGIKNRAKAMLDRGRKLVGEDDPLVALLTARMELAEWNFGGARTALEMVPKKQRDADLEAEFALLCDLEGDHNQAVKHMARAHRLDNEVFAKPVQVDPTEFLRMVDHASQSLQPELQEALINMTLTTRPMPTAELVGGSEAGNAPDSLSFCDCLDPYKCAGGDHANYPHSIVMFQRNHERKVTSVEGLQHLVNASLQRSVQRAMGLDAEI
ncbi:MAG: hypothetical protein ACI8QS_000365 [Planctomycetota bacterium]